MPDSRLVMGIQGGANGPVFKNNLADPMPIKIAGGKTLEQCVVEETEDYVLYSDGTPVVIQQYVSGTYDLYLERLNSESEAVPMLYVEGEPIIDHAKLLNDINDYQLERLANEPMTIPDDEEYVAPILEPRTIPVPIDFCCRVDKKTGEIYIGEGYENLIDGNMVPSASVGMTGLNIYEVIDLKDKKIKFTKNEESRYSNHMSLLFGAFYEKNLNDGDKVSVSFDVGLIDILVNWDLSFRSASPVGYMKIEANSPKSSVFTVSRTNNANFGQGLIISSATTFIGVETIELKNFQITKTSTPKPFIRTIMPSGKLSFVTSATSETHSFVMKGAGRTDGGTFVIGYKGVLVDDISRVERYVFRSEYSDYTLNNLGINKNAVYPSHANITCDSLGLGTKELFCLTNQYSGYALSRNEYFKQLLIYKGNLTEVELKAENDKVIDLERWQP